MKPRDVALARTPWHLRREQLSEELGELRERIAEAELKSAQLIGELGAFEHALSDALGPEQARLAEVLALLRTLEREQYALQSPALRWDERRRLVRRAQHLRSTTPASARLQLATAEVHVAAADASSADAQALRQAYLSLAREHHPDLARDERERSERGRHMAHINHLYRTQQAQALLALAQARAQGRTPPPSPHDAAADEQEQMLANEQAQLAELTAVHRELTENIASICRSDTYRLYTALGGAKASSHNFNALIEELRRDIAEHLAYLPRAHRQLEEIIAHVAAPLHSEEVQHAFSAHVHKGLARLSLTHLATLRASSQAHDDAQELVAWAAQQPTLMRLVLLTYIADLAPGPLSGLDSFEHIATRLRATSAPGEPSPSLAEALVALKDTVALGTRTPERRAAPYAGLYFIDKKVQQAVPVALRHFEVRQLFRQVLLHLGEQRRCATCAKQVFTLPLFRLRGFDNLRALVCPHCCTQLQSYLLPKGNDIQAVLNLAYLDFDVIEEFVCHLGNTTIAVQLLPDELALVSCEELVARIAQDVFVRYGVHVETRYLMLATRNGERLRSRLSLAQVQTRELELQVTTGSVWALDEAVEKVRFRARARFLPQAHIEAQERAASRVPRNETGRFH